MSTKIVEIKWLPLRRYDAITLFGIVFTRDRRRVDAKLLNHEKIHCRQQLEWLYLPFYILYVLEWLWHYICLRNTHKAYRAISFEREAYQHQANPDYLSHRPPYANYRKAAKAK